MGATLSLCATLPAQVTTYYGVSAQPFFSRPGLGNIKMDYDSYRQRFVIQYEYGTSPPKYGTLDLNTGTFQHFAQPPQGLGFETLFAIGDPSGTSPATPYLLAPRGGGGEIYEIDPSGNVSTFVSGLPGGGTGTLYSTVRFDTFGVANNDIFYANEGTGDVVRIDKFTRNIVWQTTLTDPRTQSRARPEPMIVLGSNSRWGPFQNRLLVGQNSASTTFFVLDPVTGAVISSPVSTIGGSLESFRIYPFDGGVEWALYVSIFGANTIYQLTNLSNIPNLQPGDLFVARELGNGGEIWHVYWDAGSQSFVTQKIAEFSNGYLEDMVFAPVPEPSTLLLLTGFVGATLRARRKR